MWPYLRSCATFTPLRVSCSGLSTRTQWSLRDCCSSRGASLTATVGKRLFLIGLITFAGASIGAAQSGSVDWLYRVARRDGLGAALTIPASLSITTTSFAIRRNARRPSALGAGRSVWASRLVPLREDYCFRDSGGARSFSSMFPSPSRASSVSSSWSPNRRIHRPHVLTARRAPLLSIVGLGTVAVGDHRSPDRGLDLRSRTGSLGREPRGSRFLRPLGIS